ncbi:hypothetical protein Patl1_31608 [Pistacia atlantica]|uniref:Uncharacterized protein n=1 Tax=Pistacia atlantica TaxID=434234 RepID=A0ACC1ARK9_9ROSI|nr:hypothetical protein Patl1_31608 [Pistacia atlantica]
MLPTAKCSSGVQMLTLLLEIIKMVGKRYCGLVYAVLYGYLVLFAVAQITDPSEVSALVAVMSRLIDPMNHLGNWNEGDPCQSNWTGVLCSDTINETDGYLHVQDLHLLNMNLSGSLSPELGQLSRLRILNFMWNDLTGSIPKEIGNISSLLLLLLNGNRLSGSLPEELGKLSNLNRLQVDENNISGTIPKSFANMTSMRHFHLNNNSIVGQLPPKLFNLSRLIHLLVDNNNLTGSLPPEYSELPTLRILYVPLPCYSLLQFGRLQLDNNNFSGTEIPATYGNFSSLVKLSLRHCSLQGAVPDLSRIPTLYYLDLSGNQLTGPIPSNKLSDNMRTIDMSENSLNGSIPASFSDLPSLQRLCELSNLNMIFKLCFTSGHLITIFWMVLSRLAYGRTMSLSSSARLSLFIVILRNNNFSSVLGDLNPPNNVTLRLGGNPICTTANIPNIDQFCDSEAEDDETITKSTNSKCPIEACPTDIFYEYVPASGDLCTCAAPLRIGYRLKSPSFSYFGPYANLFEAYVTRSLNLSIYQLSVDSIAWEKGPRLRMYLKLFPHANSTMFNTSEVLRIREIFTSWGFPGHDLFGPYELLNFTLLGPYASSIRNISDDKKTCQKSALPVKKADVASSSKNWHQATDNFNRSTQVGQGGYGKVYKGILSDNTVVAIKRAEEGSLQGQNEFLTEIKLLSRLHHRNLVSLLGYCDEDEEQMLVYEFMPNGTLRDWLSENKTYVQVNVARESGLMFSVIDNRMGSYPSECIERFVALALNCCHDKTEQRPSMSDVVRELETILKIIPETDATFSESTSMHSGSKSTSASASSSFMTRDQYFSSNVLGSDLVSGVIPTISPR